MIQVLKQKPDVRRSIAVLVCVASAVLCFAYAYFRQQLPDWWRGHGGGIPYVVFWIAIGFVVFPYRRAIVPVSIFATGFTCLLEILQLWHPSWLSEFRASRFGAALIGSGFDWRDFPPYFIGGLMGWAVLNFLAKICREKDTESR